ncbi:sodium:solute symporter [Enterobacterales bacterium CwR94]|nr:sodium:solute symporter [Enterobacterales bacterium CwR94]
MKQVFELVMWSLFFSMLCGLGLMIGAVAGLGYLKMLAEVIW